MLDPRAVFAALAALLVARLAAQLGGQINHDTAWYLHSAGELLDGGRLYRDIFVEVNPPLGLYLTVPPVALARLTGSFPADVFVLYVFALIGLSLVLVWRLLRAFPELPTRARHGLVLAAAVILAVSPADQFGQREHFLMVLVLPYLVLAALRAAGGRCPWPLALAVGAAAALGFALKPHFLLTPLALEAYLLATWGRPRRLVRPETLALAAVGALYAASLPVFTPDYLGRIVPYALQVYNDAYRHPLWINLIRGETLLLPLACALHVATRRQQRHPAPADVFLIASVVFFAAYVVQMKGWDYQLYPASTCMTLGYAALFLDALGGRRNGGPGRVVLAAFLAAAVLPVAGDSLRGVYRNGFMELMAPHVERHAAGGSIAFLTTNVKASFPLVNNYGVGWSSRFPALWLLPGAVGRSGEGFAEIERFTRDAVVEDFTRRPPALVIVDVREKKSYFGGRPFDYIDFFTADPRFADIWARYERVAEEPGYRLYARRPRSGSE